MSVLAAAESHTLWIVALGIGAVVVLVVIVLMALLLRYLKDIEARAARLVEVGDDVGRNTANIEQDSAAESGVAFPHGTSRQVTWKEG